MLIDGTKVRIYEVSTIEGLRLRGLENAKTGRVMLSRPASGGLGLKKHLYFTFRRKADSYVTRAGTLAGAKVTELDGKVSLVQFHLSHFSNLAADIAAANEAAKREG